MPPTRFVARILFCSFAVVCGGSAVPAADDPRLALDELRRAYADFPAHTAVYKFVIRLQPGTSDENFGTASFEYSVAGNRYCVTARSERHLGFANDSTYCFDGTTSFFLDHDLGLLSVQSGDFAYLPTAVPNPLLLPFELLGDPGLDKPHWRVLQQRSSWDLTGMDGITSIGSDRQSGESTRLADVQVEEHSGRLVPVRIVRKAPSGSIEARVEIVYADVLAGPAARGIPLPSVMRLESFGADPVEVTMRTRISLVSISATGEPQAEEFRIDESRAKSVWNGDVGSFTKSRHAQH
jgi:hypothetical protein